MSISIINPGKASPFIFEPGPGLETASCQIVLRYDATLQELRHVRREDVLDDHVRRTATRNHSDRVSDARSAWDVPQLLLEIHRGQIWQCLRASMLTGHPSHLDVGSPILHRGIACSRKQIRPPVSAESTRAHPFPSSCLLDVIRYRPIRVTDLACRRTSLQTFQVRPAMTARYKRRSGVLRRRSPQAESTVRLRGRATDLTHDSCHETRPERNRLTATRPLQELKANQSRILDSPGSMPSAIPAMSEDHLLLRSALDASCQRLRALDRLREVTSPGQKIDDPRARIEAVLQASPRTCGCRRSTVTGLENHGCPMLCTTLRSAFGTQHRLTSPAVHHGRQREAERTAQPSFIVRANERQEKQCRIRRSALPGCEPHSRSSASFEEAEDKAMPDGWRSWRSGASAL